MINNCTLLSTCTWSGNTIDVAHGGTGLTSTTANGILCGGTTSTGALQNAGAGIWGQFLMAQGNNIPIWISSIGARLTTNALYNGVMCAGVDSTLDLQNIGTGTTTGQVLTSTGANSLPSWTTPSTNNVLQFDCSLFLNYSMFTGQTYLLSSLFNNVYVDQTNVSSSIVLPNIGNGNYLTSCSIR